MTHACPAGPCKNALLCGKVRAVIATAQVAPLSFIVAAAGGATHDGQGCVLKRTIKNTQERSIVSLGCRDLVRQSIRSLQASA